MMPTLPFGGFSLAAHLLILLYGWCFDLVRGVLEQIFNVYHEDPKLTSSTRTFRSSVLGWIIPVVIAIPMLGIFGSIAYQLPHMQGNTASVVQGISSEAQSRLDF